MKIMYMAEHVMNDDDNDGALNRMYDNKGIVV